jgi:hypothetical protein
MVMQPRKLARRAFTGLVGPPPEPAVAPTPSPAAAPEPVMPEKPKRGRPRKHPSNAVRQAQYRKRKQEPERQALVAEILKQIRGREHELTGLTIRELKYYALWIRRDRIS